MPKKQQSQMEPTIRVLGITSLGPSSNPLFLSRLQERILWLLVARMPTAVTAHDLALTVWEHELPDTYQSALRTHVALVRRALRDSGGPELVHGGDGYRLDGDPETVDVHRFSALISASWSAASVSLQKKLLDEAAELWLGEPFNDVDDKELSTFAEQLVGMREASERQRRLLAVEMGNAESVVSEVAPLVEKDPSNLLTLEPLLAALLTLRRTREARFFLSKHRSALDRVGLEFGTTASALERRLLRQELEHLDLEKAIGRVPNLEVVTPLAGRKHILEAFDASLADESVSYFLLRGPAGHGKTRLISELCRRARSLGHGVVAVFAEEHSPPHQMLRDLLGTLTTTLADVDVEMFDDILAAVADLRRERALRSDSRIVVVLEDLHFADLATAKLLRRLVRKEAIDGVFFVFTARDVVKTHAVEMLLSDTQSLSTARTLIVDPLTVEETVEFVRQTNGISIASAWSSGKRIFRQSGGIPLVIEFLAAHGDPGGSLAPITVTNAILTATSKLTSDELDVVVTGSLLGTEVDFGTVAAASGVSVAHVADAFSEAAAAGLTFPYFSKTVRFRHLLIRRALWSSRPLVWRCERHKTLAAELKNRGADVFLVGMQIASSVAAAVDGRAFQEVMAIADSLQTALRWEESLALLETLEATVEMQPNWLDRPSLFRYHLTIATSQDGCADASLARRSFRKAASIAIAENNSEWLFETAMRSAGSSQSISGDSERIEWLRAASDPQSGLDSLRRIEALAELCYLRSLVGVDDEVAKCVDEMERLSSTITSERAQAFFAHGKLVSMISMADVSPRMELARIAATLTADVPPEVSTTAHLVLMSAWLQLGRRDMLGGTVADLEHLASQRQRPGDRWVILLVRAMLDEWDGQFESAARYAEMAFELAQRHEVQGGFEAYVMFQLARIVRSREAKMLEPFVDIESEGLANKVVACWYSAITDDSRANPSLVEVSRELRLADRNLAWVALTLIAGEAAAISNSSEVEVFWDLLVPYSGQIVVNGLVPVSTFGPVDRVLALLAAAIGKLAESRELATAAKRQVAESKLAGWI